MIHLQDSPSIAAEGSSRSHIGLGWLRVGLNVLAVTLIALAVLSCTSPRGGVARTQASSTEELQRRFLLGGWVIPIEEQAGPFSEELKAFVISSERELKEFLDDLRLFRIRGQFEALSDTDYSQRVLLAAYFLWRPLKGLPLSLDGVSLDSESEVHIDLRLEDAPGREAPYLAAPLHIVALDRELLPRGVPINFLFLINGEEAATVTSVLK